MSRASEITLFIILVQASIGFIDASGMFSQHFMNVPSNNASYTLTDLESYTASTNRDESITSQLDLYLNWAWESFLIGLKVLGAIVFVLPALVDVFGFHMTDPIVLFIQVGIYYVYATWYSQYKSGKGWRLYE